MYSHSVNRVEPLNIPSRFPLGKEPDFSLPTSPHCARIFFMRRTISSMLLYAVFVCGFARPAQAQTADLLENAKTATVFVAKFNALGKFIGWGSGFFVDEGIVVTNKHVVEGGQYFKIFPIEANGTVDLDCGRELGLSDIKVNLHDDAAYIRAYPACPHGVLWFTDSDPKIGEPVSVLGFPARGTLAESLALSVTAGHVTGTTDDGWFTTDAFLHFGNSGGPVVTGGKVLGVAVAKSTDAEGNYVTGYFVPVSVILNGLLYGNSSTFGYTPQDRQKNLAYAEQFPFGRERDPFDPPRRSRVASDEECRQSIGEGGEATGDGGCRCKANYRQDSTGMRCVVKPEEPASQASSSSVSPHSPNADAGSSSSASVPKRQPRVQTPFQIRTCERILKWFAGNDKMMERVNARLKKRFSFVCGG